MNVLALAAVLLVPATLAPALGDVPATPVPAASAAANDDLTYNDAAMHFRAPDGWMRVPVNPETAGQDGAPSAVYVQKAGKEIHASISITISSFDGSLSEFASSHTQSIRAGASSGDVSAYIEKRLDVKTGNGMPCVELVWTLTPTGSVQIRNYEYLFIDGQRSVDVKYSGHLGDISDKDAAAVFSSLYAVGYPRARSSN